MPTYRLYITRVHEYHVEADRPADVWDAYLNAEEMEEVHEETTGHVVCNDNGDEVDRQGRPL